MAGAGEEGEDRDGGVMEQASASDAEVSVSGVGQLANVTGLGADDEGTVDGGEALDGGVIRGSPAVAVEGRVVAATLEDFEELKAVIRAALHVNRPRRHRPSRG